MVNQVFQGLLGLMDRQDLEETLVLLEIPDHKVQMDPSVEQEIQVRKDLLVIWVN